MKDTLEKLKKIYDNSLHISEWAMQNKPDEDLIYRSGVGTQEQKMLGISYVLGIEPPKVVETHSSKSVGLPVAAYYKNIPAFDLEVMAFVRDNFYGLNCVVVSSHQLDIGISNVYDEIPREKLEEKKKGALEYSFRSKDWVKKEHAAGRTYTKDTHQIITDAGEDNWDWYEDYSGTTIIRDSGRYFQSHRAFLEGISKLPLPGMNNWGNHYIGPCKDFTFTSGSYAKVASVIERAFWAAEKQGYKDRREQDELRT